MCVYVCGCVHTHMIWYVISGGSGPGPIRALAHSSKLAVMVKSLMINKNFASSARIHKKPR